MPSVMPIVLYNGRRRWTAPRDLDALIKPGPVGLAVYRPHELNSLEEVRIMLAERVVDWTQQWKQEGLQEGLHIQRNLERWPCQSIR